jgi:hypothetical protein
MNGANWITVIGGAVVTILPQVVGIIPAPYSEIASGVLAAVLAAWHLYQPSPSNGTSK